MKYLHAKCKAVSLTATFFCAIAVLYATAVTNYDTSTPRTAFESLQSAVKNQDMEGLAQVTLQSLEQLKALKETEKHGFWKKLDHLSGAAIVRIEQIAAGKQFTSDVAKIWWKSPGRTIMGCVTLGLVGDRWRLLDTRTGNDMYWSTYDFTDPIATFQALKHATSHDVRDAFSIFGALSSTVKDGLSFEQYDKVVKWKIDNEKGEDTELRYPIGQLEQERVLSPEGHQQCKVWKLNKDKKRIGVELFVKEGNEWKWVPDRKSIWYPK